MGWKSVAAALAATYDDCSGMQPIFAIWFLPTRKFKRTGWQQRLEPPTQFPPTHQLNAKDTKDLRLRGLLTKAFIAENDV